MELRITDDFGTARKKTKEMNYYEIVRYMPRFMMAGNISQVNRISSPHTAPLALYASKTTEDDPTC